MTALLRPCGVPLLGLFVRPVRCPSSSPLRKPHHRGGRPAARAVASSCLSCNRHPPRLLARPAHTRHAARSASLQHAVRQVVGVCVATTLSYLLSQSRGAGAGVVEERPHKVVGARLAWPVAVPSVVHAVHDVTPRRHRVGSGRAREHVRRAGVGSRPAAAAVRVLPALQVRGQTVYGVSSIKADRERNRERNREKGGCG